MAVFVEPVKFEFDLRDSDDEFYLATAAAGGDVLITGNMRDFMERDTGWLMSGRRENSSIGQRDCLMLARSCRPFPCFTVATLIEVMHPQLDETSTYNEDRCRIRTGNGAENFSILRRFAIAVVRRHNCELAPVLRHLRAISG